MERRAVFTKRDSDDVVVSHAAADPIATLHIIINHQLVPAACCRYHPGDKPSLLDRSVSQSIDPREREAAVQLQHAAYNIQHRIR